MMMHTQPNLLSPGSMTKTSKVNVSRFRWQPRKITGWVAEVVDAEDEEEVVAWVAPVTVDPQE